ncbi:hypothetical protein [Winogradskyella sp.]|uniref:hypothetical protein n=1 Tax=Winogradskyella sp. TaxID=1883156 RepID=UPI001B11F925|nr:hypothetical protein [Winogradskyella sp.]MBO6880822.1 hypothetical protein [Winogradskyella sp.]
MDYIKQETFDDDGKLIETTYFELNDGKILRYIDMDSPTTIVDETPMKLFDKPEFIPNLDKLKETETGYFFQRRTRPKVFNLYYEARKSVIDKWFYDKNKKLIKRERFEKVHHDYELVHIFKYDAKGNVIYEFLPDRGYDEGCEDLYDETTEIFKTYKYDNNNKWIVCDISQRIYRNYTSNKHLNKESIEDFKSKRKYGDFSQIFKKVEDENAKQKEVWDNDEFRDLPF